MKQARERLMETFKEMIDRRRSGKEFEEDFLQSMLEKDSCPPSEKLDDSELMDNLLTMIIAGQTTTAAAMMWSVKFLDSNREAQDKLRVSFMQSFFSFYLVIKIFLSWKYKLLKSTTNSCVNLDFRVEFI